MIHSAKTPSLQALLTNALRKVADAVVRSRAQAQEWLLPGEVDIVPPAPPQPLTAAQFVAAGESLLAFWQPANLEAVVEELKNILRADGFQPGRVNSGARTAGTKCHGRYISIDVKDPVFGSFVVRLWLLADWERGLQLHLGAYRPVKPAHALKYPVDVEPGAIALETMGFTRMCWSSMTLPEAQAALWKWQKGMLATGAAGSVGIHWPALRSALEAARAP